MSYEVVGIVVNPKLREPVLVGYDGDEVEIWSMLPDGGRIGMGGYETSDPAYLGPSYVTGLPRVHTPSGVNPTGKGYGTTLYTGLCVGAHLNAGGEFSLDDVEYDGDGVSSDQQTRSASADAWWERARKLGLTDRVEDEHTEQDVEFDMYDIECQHSEGSVSIDYARGDITKTIVADAYYYDSAYSADLVIASFYIKVEGTFFRKEEERREGKRTKVHYSVRSGALRNVWKSIVADKADISDVELNALLALDMRRLDPQAVNLLSALAVHAGANDDDIDALRLRAEMNLDPSTSIKQMRLPFTPNASEQREIESIMAHTKELREGLDWKRLSSLP